MPDLVKNDPLQPGFTYSGRNPYKQKLEQHSEFVFQNENSENYQGKWNDVVFTHDRPLHLEIGAGYGEFMLQYCQENPDVNYVGMDFRFKRTYQLSQKLDQVESKNFRYLRAKAERLPFIFGENELTEIYFFFPDPWPKKRHHKKRLFQESFLENCYKTLGPQKKVYIKTDHDHYFGSMLDCLKNQSYFNIKFQTFDLWNDSNHPFLCSFTTKFEKIFVRQGVPIKALVLESTKL